MLTKEQILNLFQLQTIQLEWSFENYKPLQTKKWSHSYHRYPEYIDTENAHINDPFMGSGTTVVTAISRGFKASGVDINRLAHLITQVKATPIEPKYLDSQIKQFLGRLSFLLESKTVPLIAPVKPLIPESHLDKINYWFLEPNRHELGQILRIIEDSDEPVIRDFLRVAFSHILKNCSIWIESL